MSQEDPFNRGGLIAFIFSMAFSLIFIVYVSFMHPGVDLKEVPDEPGVESAEQTVAGDSEPAAEAVDVSSIENPWEPSQALIAHGNQVFQANCAVCHGSEGKGDGPAGQALIPPPRNFVEGNWTKGGSRKELFETTTNGIAGSSMAPFGHLPVNDRWAVVHFIRSITQNKVDGDPKELEEFAKTAK